MRSLIALVLVLFLIPSMGTADTLYKWVDAQGNVHYSDKPAPGATKIDVPKAPTFTPPAIAQPSNENRSDHRFQNQKSSDTQAEAAGGYTSLAISSPKDQETLWNVPSVTVSVNLQPALQPGDSVTITLDGASQTVAGTSATFNDVIRGQHTVTASIGRITAAAVTFYIQKTSTQKPKTH
jgi:uncharacterized protein DUF4124